MHGFELFLATALLIVVAAYGFMYWLKQRGIKALQQWQNTWLKVPLDRSPKSEEIAGVWTGEYSYSKDVGSTIKQSGNMFTATFSEDFSVVTGQMEDSIGQASLSGIIDYPNVRLMKQYYSVPNERSIVLPRPDPNQSATPHTLRTRTGSIVYYEGRLTFDGKAMTGEWFQHPSMRNFWSGTWRMTLVERTAPAHGMPVAADASAGKTVSADATIGIVANANATAAITPTAEVTGATMASADLDQAIALPLAAPTPVDADLVPAVKQGVPIDEKVKCSNCGEESAATYSFCLYCGHSHGPA